MLHLLLNDVLVSCPLSIGSVGRSGFAIEPLGWTYGIFHLSSVPVRGEAPLMLGIEPLWTSTSVPTHVHVFFAYVIRPFDSVSRCILDCVVSRFGLFAWFRRAYVLYRGFVRLRFMLAVGIGMGASFRDVRLACIFIVAFHLSW